VIEGSFLLDFSGDQATLTGILPIFACHSFGPVMCTEVPSESTATVTGPGYNDIMEKVVARHPLHQQPRDTEYWLSRSPSQRLDAVEVLRLAWLESHPDAVQGLQRVCRVIKRSRG
jgi:hypothetical protein